MTRRFSILQSGAVSDKNISDAQFRTLAALAIYGDKDGWCYPKLMTLAKLLGKSRQAVSRDIQALKKLGYIEIQAQFKERAQTSNLYRLIFDTPLSPELTPLNVDDTPPSTSEVDPPSTPDVAPLKTQLKPHLTTQENKFSCLAEKEYFTTFRRKRWSNKVQQELFASLLERYGEDDLIKAIRWAALKNIADLGRIEKALQTMSKNKTNPEAKNKSNEDGSMYV